MTLARYILVHLVASLAFNELSHLSFTSAFSLTPPPQSSHSTSSHEMVAANNESIDQQQTTTSDDTIVPTSRFIVQNRFRVKPGREPAFEKRWADRKSRLATLAGFRFSV